MISIHNTTSRDFTYSNHNSFDRPPPPNSKSASATMEACLAQNLHASSSMSAACASATPSTQPHSAPPSPPPPSGRVPRVVHPLPTAPRCVINIEFFEFLLNSHPNRAHVNYVLDGLRAGFDIGFLGSSVATHPKNLRSAKQLEHLLSEAVAKEVQRGHTAGSFPEPFLVLLMCPL